MHVRRGNDTTAGAIGHGSTTLTAGSPADARQMVRSSLESWGWDDLIDDAELMVSELVTNTIVHTDTTHAIVALHRHPDRLRVEVTDASPLSPIRPSEPDPNRLGGLGLKIVAALALDWGVRNTERSKTVWFEVAAGAQ